MVLETILLGVSPLFVAGYEAPEMNLDGITSFADARKEATLKRTCTQHGVAYDKLSSNKSSDTIESRWKKMDKVIRKQKMKHRRLNASPQEKEKEQKRKKRKGEGKDEEQKESSKSSIQFGCRK